MILSNVPEYINLLHALIIGPFLFYIGYRGSNTPHFLFYLLAAFAIGAYFAIRIPKSDYYSVRNMIKYVHYLLLAPFLLYVAYCGKKSEKVLFGLLKIIGIAVIAVHLYLYSEKKKFVLIS
tara:strand:- start:292 stop:654 length:363 start_codon:yes stop_codon:yes gene_type:complete